MTLLQTLVYCVVWHATRMTWQASCILALARDDAVGDDDTRAGGAGRAQGGEARGPVTMA
jgi:hypothetical protein